MAAGGAYGYVKSKSVPSESDAKLGHDVSLATSVLLGGAMGARAARTKKFMPAGLLTALATLSTAYHLKKSLEWRGIGA